MSMNHETGISRVVLGVVGVGVLAVAGTIFLLVGAPDKEPVKAPEAATKHEGSTPVVSDIQDPKGSRETLNQGEEEEEPTLIRTVDEKGKTTFIGKKKATVFLPGKGKRQFFKIATATGRRMKPLSKKPQAAKMVHPAIKRKNEKGKVKVEGNDAGGGQGEGSSTSNKGKGGQAGKGKGPGGAGGGTGGK